MIFTAAALIFVVGVLAWYLLGYNSLVQARNAVDQAWSNIEVELKRRFDLIQNLVETVKGYAKHERGTLEKVVELRANPGSFSSAASANAAQPELTRAVSQIMILAENYPQLRADQGFLKLQGELSETENRIAARRQAYNQTVNLYHNRCETFPSNIIASIHQFPPRTLFDAPDELAAKPPTVDLS